MLPNDQTRSRRACKLRAIAGLSSSGTRVRAQTIIVRSLAALLSIIAACRLTAARA